MAALDCHVPEFLLFGGTVWNADGGLAPGVAMGLHWRLPDAGRIEVCSGSTGNFYAINRAGMTLDWSQVEIRSRNEHGESVKHPPEAADWDCNRCHVGAKKLIAP